MSAPAHDEEREVKLAVPEGFAMPGASSWAPARAEDAGERELRSVYWDTEDLALARAHLGLRHRNGTWTFKGPSHREVDSVVREERELPGYAGAVPKELAVRVAGALGGGTLAPVAEIINMRRTVIVRDGPAAVELVLDRVSVRRGAEEVSRFVEVEVEFEGPSQALADRVVAVLVERGAQVSTVGKYTRALRALGRDLPPPGALPAGRADESSDPPR